MKIASAHVHPVPSEPENQLTPVRSMTGYSALHVETDAGELNISLRSVNHRGLDLHFHLGSELAIFENAMRALLKQRVSRGHVEIRLSLARENTERLTYNRELLERYIGLFREACAEFSLDSKPDLNTCFNLPGVFGNTSEIRPLDQSFEPTVLAALEACIADLNNFREREGAELLASVERETAAIEDATRQMIAIRETAHPQFLQKLTTRLTELLSDAAISPGRLAEEAALLADKSDIQEELVRLSVHTEEVRRLMNREGEVGKRLDFLLQEMNRETNTALSKTSGIGETGLTITNLALGIKANIERMREQALNLE